MARALIVGCGCRGRELGRALLAAGWQVRGTARRDDGAEAIAAAGIEAVLADPDRVGTLLEHVADAAVIYWLLGSASGSEEAVSALHGPRLERLLEEIVDTPVRGFVYEAAGSVSGPRLDAGAGLVRAAAGRWRIPCEIVDADPARVDGWREAHLSAAERLLAPREDSWSPPAVGGR